MKLGVGVPVRGVGGMAKGNIKHGSVADTKHEYGKACG